MSSKSSVKRNTAIGLTAGLLGGGAIGLMLGVPDLTSAAGSSPSVVVEQDDTPTDDTTATDDTITDDTTVTDDTTTDETTTDDESDVRPEPGVRLREKLQELVDNGTLTSEQADAVTAFLVENRPERGGHHGFPGGPGRGHFGIGIERGEIAELFGLEPDALRDLLRDGQSLADIATDQGVEVQTVIDTLVNAVKEHLDAAVDNGRLTQEEADAKLAEITERITEMVNTARPAADD
ncbi:MAG TPA: hypothetical protein VFV63_09285 [Ilumatobacteraceae bacterium]|nr:hypothetical protein [Ilumatobacteraceae bacterium]